MTSNTTFACLCVSGWEGVHCEIQTNYCVNVTCMNNGVCQPLFKNYTCECLGGSYSGDHCEIISEKTELYGIVSKSFASVAIIVMISAAIFIIIMDVLKYYFDIDPVHNDRERIRRKKRKRKPKPPIVLRYIYVNASSSSQKLNTSIEETAV
jgi:hypothetical protein